MADIRVELVDHMGSCLKVCQMAKDSFGRTTDWEAYGYAIDDGEFQDAKENGFHHYKHADGGARWYYRLAEKDQRLLKMLSRGMGDDEFTRLKNDVIMAATQEEAAAALWKFRHTTPHLAPFGHNFATFKFQAPVFVMRQVVKHEYLRLSELSMRYVRGMPEYYRPKSWRSVAEDVKQGSGGEVDEWFSEDLYARMDYAFTRDEASYESDMIDGLAPEQARMFLRLCHMTQGHISGSMDAIAGLVIKRLDPHAQEETREFARQIERQCREIWPLSWSALMEGVDVNT